MEADCFTFTYCVLVLACRLERAVASASAVPTRAEAAGEAIWVRLRCGKPDGVRQKKDVFLDGVHHAALGSGC